MMGEKKNRKDLTMKILVGVVIVLVLFIAYLFIVTPQIDKFRYNNQLMGANSVWGDMISQLQGQGYYTLVVGNETLVLVPYVPPQETQTPTQ